MLENVLIGKIVIEDKIEKRITIKYEWRKQDKKLYIPKTKPEILALSTYTYISIRGVGNPNSESFSKDIEALYALSYAIKMSPKKDYEIPGFYDYTVFPLEGVWNLTTEGQNLYKQGKSIIELKDYFTYDLMIRQPDFITKKLFNTFKEFAYQKKNLPRIHEITYVKSDPKSVCQCLHIGSYDTEPETFQKMEEHTITNGHIRAEKIHTEIYLSDARKVEPSKLKTTLRFTIK